MMPTVPAKTLSLVLALERPVFTNQAANSHGKNWQRQQLCHWLHLGRLQLRKPRTTSAADLRRSAARVAFQIPLVNNAQDFGNSAICGDEPRNPLILLSLRF
jgi:hypothetical protein